MQPPAALYLLEEPSLEGVVIVEPALAPRVQLRLERLVVLTKLLRCRAGRCASGRGLRREPCKFGDGDAGEHDDEDEAVYETCSTTLQTVCCVASARNNRVWSGQWDGSVYCWRDRNCTVAVPDALSGPVLSLCVGRGSLVFGGGSDGTVSMIDSDGNVLRRFTIRNGTAAIRSVHLNARSDR